jgi:hypothetical protein
MRGMIMAVVDMNHTMMKQRIWTTQLVLLNVVIVGIAITEVNTWLIVFYFISYSLADFYVSRVLFHQCFRSLPSDREIDFALSTRQRPINASAREPGFAPFCTPAAIKRQRNG